MFYLVTFDDGSVADIVAPNKDLAAIWAAEIWDDPTRPEAEKLTVVSVETEDEYFGTN